MARARKASATSSLVRSLDHEELARDVAILTVLLTNAPTLSLENTQLLEQTRKMLGICALNAIDDSLTGRGNIPISSRKLLVESAMKNYGNLPNSPLKWIGPPSTNDSSK